MLDRSCPIPPLYCPIPPSENPNALSAEQELRTWVGHYGFADETSSWRRLEKIRVTDFVSRAYPDATLDDLSIVLAWTAWAFLADDSADEPDETSAVDLQALATRYSAFVKTLRSGESGGRQDCAPLLDLRERILRRSSHDCLERFATAVEDWFRSMHWEVSNRAQRRLPGIREYLTERRITVGMYTTFALFDLTHQADTTTSLWQNPALQRMMAGASNIIGWSNDIFSFPKEATAGDPHNLVLLLRKHRGYSEERAVRTAQRMHDREMQHFLTIERKILRRPQVSRTVYRFIDMMKCWVRSNVDWAQLSGRYHLSRGTLSLTAMPPRRPQLLPAVGRIALARSKEGRITGS